MTLYAEQRPTGWWGACDLCPQEWGPFENDEKAMTAADIHGQERPEHDA